MFESFQGGRYKVAKKLGEGGKGTVFKAEDTRLGRTVAVKVIKGEGLDQESFARFEQEAKATASLSHPHIVAIYDIGQEGESHYLVLEFVNGPNLSGLISSQPDGRCDAAITLRIGSQVCQALECAHSRGILHRDIKPENIMITAEGLPKLMDFGLARALSGPRLTQRGVIVGTPTYLPPEQALGKHTDARSDLYSLGCVLYEMATGRPPFPGDDPVKVIFSHINDLPMMPRRIAPEIPEALEQVILKLLAKDPDKRYQSAGELFQALKSMIDAPEARFAPVKVLTGEETAKAIPTPEPRMSHVFISHSVRDKDQEAADRIYDYLENNGVRCFMDKRDLIPGVPYPRQLSNAIKESNVVLVVLSSNSDSSEPVQNEVALATNNKKQIVPVRIEDVVPHELALFLIATQWFDAFPPPLETYLPKLADGIKKLLPPIPPEGRMAKGLITLEPRWAQPLVNREQEMRILRARLDAALRGEGSLVFITGEAGIGKTRLAYELRSYAKLRGAQCLMGRSYEREGAVPYQPWSDIIKEYIRLAPPLLLFKAVGAFASELAKLVPELGEKLGTIPPPTSAPSAQQHVRLFEAVTQFFVNISKEVSLVLLLDDLQWFDEASMKLLHHMARAITAERLLVVGAYRDLELEDQRSLSRTVAEINRERLFHALPLKRLAFSGVCQMIRQMFGEKVPSELPDLVYGKTEGNPFFVEEILRSLVEEGTVYLVEKGWGVKNLSQVHVPRGIKEVLKKRLECLDEESNHVLSAAAVIGREFSFPVLREVTSLDEDRLIDIIEKCLHARLLVDRHVPGEEVYAFADNQIRDVLYEDISPVRRKRHHLKVGQAVEKVYARKIGDHLESLAYHFLEGNDLSKAIDYSQKAGDKAKRLFAYDQARRHYETALKLM